MTGTTEVSGPDETAQPPGVCGDGVLDPDEACDDGNEQDADGCSHRCEISGSVSWMVDLSVEPAGFGVGLDVRDGQAYAGVQQHADIVDMNMSVSRVSGEGLLLGNVFDPGGLSDLSVAPQPIAGTPQGSFIAGYPIIGSDRDIAQIDFGEGLQWSAPTQSKEFYGTIWRPDGIFMLRSSMEDNELVVLRFSEQGELVGELQTGLLRSEHSPLVEGGLPARPASLTLAVLTRSPEGVVYMSSGIVPEAGGGDAGSWATVEVASSEPGSQVRAFGHVANVAVWTEDERILFDMFDHFIEAEPRTVPGKVLVSFDAGFAIVEDQRIDVYDNQDDLRWSHDSGLTPAFARVDGQGGMFVLSDAGVYEDTIHLEYLVL